MTHSQRSRCLLHKSHLLEFARFCEADGWTPTPCRGAYEVLRMYKPHHDGTKRLLIVHERLHAKEHYTTWGASAMMTRLFLAHKKGS